MGMGTFQIWSDTLQSLNFPMQCQILWSRIWVVVLKGAFRMVPFCRDFEMTGNPFNIPGRFCNLKGDLSQNIEMGPVL